MRVLHVIDSLGRGGAEMFLLHLLPELRELGISCDILYLSEPSTLEDSFKALGVNVYSIDRAGFPKSIAIMAALHRLCREKRYSFVNAHLFWSSWYAGLYSLVTRFPVAFTFHNLEFDAYKVDSFKRRLRRYLFGFVLRNCKGTFTAVSYASGKSYRDHCGITSVEVLPVTVNLSKLPTRQSTPQCQGEVRISLVATLKKGKGHSVLIESLSRIIEKRPELGRRLRLQFVGGGPLESELRAKAKEMLLLEQVEFFGSCSSERTLQILAESHILALPSFSEGLPVSVLEAMGVGIPVIASRVGGIPELITDGSNGLLVEPGDVDSLSGAIVSFLDAPALAVELGNAGRSCVMESYDLPVVSKRWARYYQGLEAQL